MNLGNIDAGFHLILQALQNAIKDGEASRGMDFCGLTGDMMAFYRKYWNLPVEWPYAELLKMLEKPADRLVAAAHDAESRCLPDAAMFLAESASKTGQDTAYDVMLASCARKSSNLQQARAICTGIELRCPGSQNVLSELFMCSVAEQFWSRDYYDLLAEIHQKHTPKAYLEIGVATGKSLALTKRFTTALGIDPATAAREMLVYHSPENDPRLYKMTSDDFFAGHDLKKEMGRAHFDVAFIDGLHHFDQVLRDFINLEPFAGPDSIVLIHDCLPVDPRVATRERSTAFWTGDVWKIIPCLRAVRPDLEIITLPLPPAGLALVRGMDPNSRLLSRQYINVVEQFDTLELPDSWEERCSLLAVEKEESRFSIADYVPKGGWS